MERELAHIGVRAEIEPAGLQRVRNEDIERARTRAGRIAVLLGEGANDGRPASVEGARQRGLWRRERIPAERFASLVEFLRIARHGKRRAGIPLASWSLKEVCAGLAGNDERPLDF